MEGPTSLLDPQLEELMRRMGASEQDRRDANKQAAFAFGFSMLAHPQRGQTLQAFGNAGMNAMGARQAALADIPKQKLESLNAALGVMKANQAAQQMQQAQQKQQAMTGAFSDLPQLQNMGPGGPTPANAAAIAPPSQVDQYRRAAVIAAQHGDTEGAKRLSDIANSMEEQFNTTPQTLMGANNLPASVLISQRGKTKELPYLPKPDIKEVRNGASISFMDPLTQRRFGSDIPMQMSPGETASNQVALGHLALARNADARAAAAAAQGGKPQWDSTAGMFVYPPSPEAPSGRVAQPEGYNKMDKPLTESQAKATAYANQMAKATTDLNDLATQKKPFTGTGGKQQLQISMAGAEGFPFVPGSAAIPRAMSSDDAQKYDQATMQWTEAALRFMTGANAPEPEVRRNRATYFPLPGDSPAKIAQKEASRATMEESIRMAAGPGIKKLPSMPQQKADVRSLADKILAGQ